MDVTREKGEGLGPGREVGRRPCTCIPSRVRVRVCKLPIAVLGPVRHVAFSPSGRGRGCNGELCNP